MNMSDITYTYLILPYINGDILAWEYQAHQNVKLNKHTFAAQLSLQE